MKYLTFAPPGEFPFALLFSGHIKHDTIAAKIGQPVQGAGFVTIPDAVAFPGGFSSSLNKGASKLDADLIRAGLTATSAFYPPPPAHVTPTQRLAAIEHALTAYHVALRNREHGGVSQSRLTNRLEEILGKRFDT